MQELPAKDTTRMHSFSFEAYNKFFCSNQSKNGIIINIKEAYLYFIKIIFLFELSINVVDGIKLFFYGSRSQKRKQR